MPSVTVSVPLDVFADEGRVGLAMQPPETNPAKPDDSGLTALVGFANGPGAALIDES